MKPSDTYEYIKTVIQSQLDYDEIVDISITQAKKQGSLNGITQVVLSGNELACLRLFSDYKTRKLLFGMMVLAKWEGSGNVYPFKKSDSNAYLKIRMSMNEINTAGNLIYNTFPNIMFMGKKTVYWNFNNLPKIENDYPILLVEVDNPNASFPSFCSVCNKMYLNNSGRKEFCDDCSDEKSKERKRKWWNNTH
jgi:hypothetical protein